MQRIDRSNGAFSGVIWKFSERITAQLVTAVVSIILARILMPEDYGVVAIVTILITIFNALVVGGFGNSLIQKKDADELDFSSIFFFSLGTSLGVYVVIFFLAIPVAGIYHNESLILIIRIMGIRIPFAAVNSIQQAYLSKKMQFKKFFFATLIGTIVSAFVGVVSALKGLGPFALVFQYLTNVIIDTIVLFLIGGWRPKICYSWNRVKILLPYGLKIMGTNLLDAVFTELRGAVISIKYSSVDLAMYDNGKKYPNLLTTNVNSSIGSVIFPVFSNIQEDKSKIKTIMHRAISVSSYILVPLLFGFAAIASRFVGTVLTDKWNGCIPFIYITCMMCVFYPIHTINFQALNAIGKSGLTFRLEIVKKVINILILLITMFYGTLWIAIGALFVSLLSTFVNGFYSKKYFDYSIFKQLLDVIPIYFASLVMAIIVFTFDRIVPLNSWILLIVDILLGFLIYMTISFVFHFEALRYLLIKIKSLFTRYSV